MPPLVWFWVVLGLVLILGELVVPGVVIVFPGVAALLIALGTYLGYLDTWPSMLGWWLGSTTVLVLLLRRICLRFLPGETQKGNIDEDLDAFGTLVKVVQVDPSRPQRGRIAFRGTTWDAECLDEHMVEGAFVRLIQRENMLWVVEHPDALPTTQT